MSSSAQAGNSRFAANTEPVDEEFTADTVRIAAVSMIPEVFTNPPLVRDDLETHSSQVQDEVVESCLPFMSGDVDDIDYNNFGLPHLDRKRHIKFLHKNLGKLPSPYISADSSRPWFFFWCLNGLTLLGEDVSSYRDRLVETIEGMQNPTGGFGGGFGQTSHLATTYAVVLALSIVGGEDCYEVIDRRSLWRWLCSLKQADGGFQMCVGGEEDIRGAYCAAVVISLLNLPLDLTRDSPAWTPDQPTLYTGLADYVRRCQTFEGGISAQPDAEAHGAYAFCALGCLSILASPDVSIPRYLNVPRLISWLSSRQYAPEGGFSGRTNKLVDGCYSHWVGGCWPLIEACLNSSSNAFKSPAAAGGAAGAHSALPACSQSLFSREGLIRYILCCCQDHSRRGGLRDKPGKHSDAYHTCYVLSGLSSAENKWELVTPPTEQQAADEEGNTSAAATITSPKWTVSPYLDEVQIFDEQDRVGAIHPVYTIPEKCVEQIQAYYASRVGF